MARFHDLTQLKIEGPPFMLWAYIETKDRGIVFTPICQLTRHQAQVLACLGVFTEITELAELVRAHDLASSVPRSCPQHQPPLQQLPSAGPEPFLSRGRAGQSQR